MRDVSDPAAVRGRGREHPVELVGLDVFLGARTPGGRPQTGHAGLKPRDPHQAGNAMAPGTDPACLQFGVHTRIAVGLAAAFKDGLDRGQQCPVGPGAIALRSRAPGVVAARADLQQPAHPSRRVLRAMGLDEVVAHFASRAK